MTQLIFTAVAALVVLPIVVEPRLLLRLIAALIGVGFYGSATGALHLALSDLLVPVLAISTMVMRPTSKARAASDLRSEGTRAVTLGVGLLLWGSLSTLFAALADPEFSVQLAASNVLKMSVSGLYLVVTYLAARRLKAESFMRIIDVWIWIAAIQGALSFVSQLIHVNIIPSDGVRSLGFFADPNLYGGFLLVSMCLVLVRTQIKSFSLWWIPSLALFFGIVATGSRGTLLGLVCVVAATIFLVSSGKVRIVALTVSLSGGLWMVHELGNPDGKIGALNRLASAAGQAGADPRVMLWHTAITEWAAHPIFGVGIGQFTRFTAGIGGFVTPDGQGYVAHNTFLSFAVELGTPGLLLLLALFVYIAACINRSALTRQLRGALIVGLIAIASEMMTLNLQNTRYVWFYMGIALAATVVLQEKMNEAGGRAGQSARSSASATVPRPGRHD
jgi:O-antigen ligase